MQRLTLLKVRFGLFTALLVSAPLSKFPSVATPLYNFTSFRIGLYQLLMLLFVLSCLPGLIRSLKTLYAQQKLALISVAALAAVCILSLFTAIDRPRSALLVASILLLLLSVLAAWWYVAKELPKDRYTFLFKAILSAGCVFGVVSILQFLFAGFGHETFGLLCKNCGSQVFGFPRINGFAAEPQFYANALLIYFFAGLGAFYYSHSKLALGSCLLSLIGIGLTFSRGAFLAVIVGVVLFYVLLRIQGRLRIRTLLLHFVVVIITAVAVSGLLVTAASYRYRGTPDIAYKTFRSLIEQASLGVVKLPRSSKTSGFQPAGLIQASANERLTAAQLSLRAWGYSPITRLIGVGSGNLGPFVDKHIDASTPDNLTVYIFYSLLLSELGLIGVAAFFGLFASALAGFLGRFWRNKDAAIYTALFALGVAFLVQYCFFGSYINVTYIWLFIGILLGLGRKTSKQRYNKGTK